MNRQLKADIIQWDIRNWGKALDFWQGHLPASGQALTLGERDGGLTLWMAKAGLKVTSTDLEGVTEAGRALHERYQVTQNITYASANMLNLHFEDSAFDVVAFKSVLGALSTAENQQQAIAEMYRVLKPGGKLLFAENLEGSSLHRALRKRFVKWSEYWRYLNLKEDLVWFDRFAQFEYQTHGNLALLGRSEGQRNLLGAVDGVIRPVVPRKARYIIFAVARK